MKGKYFLDANVIISGLLWKGGPRQLLDLGERSEIRLVTSDYVLAEVRDFLQGTDFEGSRIDGWLEHLTGFMQVIRVSKREIERFWDALDDKKDIAVLAAAVRAKAILVTGDIELLKKAGKYVDVISVRKALNGD